MTGWRTSAPIRGSWCTLWAPTTTRRRSLVQDGAFRARFFNQSNPEVHWYTSQAELAELVGAAPMIEVVFES